MKYLTNLSDVEKQLRSETESKYRMQSLHQTELEELRTKHGIVENELKSQLESLSESNQRCQREIQQLLNEQRVMGERW